jgi:hypothetical protein
LSERDSPIEKPDARAFYSCAVGHPTIWWKSLGMGNATNGTGRPRDPCPLCTQRRRTRKLEAVQRHAEYLRGQLNEWERRAGKRLTKGPDTRGYFDDE